MPVLPTAIQALVAEREFQAPRGAAGIARRQGRTAYGQQVARSLKFHHLLLPVGEAAEALQLLRLGRGSVGKHPQILSRVAPSQLVFPPLSKLCTSLRLNSFSTLAAAATRTAVATRLVTRLLEETGGRRARIPQVQSHR